MVQRTPRGALVARLGRPVRGRVSRCERGDSQTPPRYARHTIRDKPTSPVSAHLLILLSAKVRTYQPHADRSRIEGKLVDSPTIEHQRTVVEQVRDQTGLGSDKNDLELPLGLSYIIPLRIVTSDTNLVVRTCARACDDSHRIVPALTVGMPWWSCM